MATKAVDLTYSLHPPSSVNPPTAGPSSQPIPSSSTLTFPVSTSVSSSDRALDQLPPSINESTSATSAYYQSLTVTIRQVQNTLNETLTQWKDAVGDSEKHKEDLGKVAHGQGRATVMSLAVNKEYRKSVPVKPDDDSESDDDDDDASD
ncbi:uncharacterized protein IL334_007382 [Kwoniella shivajii]|uniref:EKC/KEOPS complex subunit GON7 n=1 Tax=Kwoniella shivajii TaxID=564305 RepID=A0ABZ1DAS6_9TREE|nr:hypothetical protein IL334_007382 [Kwoniella shivajii]